MRFSPRLKALLAMVEGRCLADIGTDHGYLPIAACLNDVVERAVACDLSPGPLEIARKNILSYGLEDRIDLRLGYGLQPLLAGEADCIVISGMGGMNIIEILNDPSIELQGIKRLILQPQRDAAAVRLTLGGLGFEITKEAAAKDRRHSYIIIAAELKKAS